MFQQVQDVLEKEKFFDILQDQARIFDSDNQVSIFFPKHWKNLSMQREQKWV
jgi:hypothetical protein